MLHPGNAAATEGVGTVVTSIQLVEKALALLTTSGLVIMQCNNSRVCKWGLVGFQASVAENLLPLPPVSRRHLH